MPFRTKKRAVEPPVSVEGVWIVQHDDSPHNTVLGVFAAQAEASKLADEVGDQFINGLIYSWFTIGYRYDRGTGHVTYGVAD